MVLFVLQCPGWTLGTYLGVVLGNVMPDRILGRNVSVALYGMFIVLIIPPSRKDKVIAGLIVISMAASSLFTYIPVLRSDISAVFSDYNLTVVIAGVAAILFPVKPECEPEESGGA